jgi:hypothetical protein
MTDRHVRILAMVARRSQRRFDDHTTAITTPSAASSQRGQELERRATRTRARVDAAQARRRQA